MRSRVRQEMYGERKVDVCLKRSQVHRPLINLTYCESNISRAATAGCTLCFMCDPSSGILQENLLNFLKLLFQLKTFTGKLKHLKLELSDFTAMPTNTGHKLSAHSNGFMSMKLSTNSNGLEDVNMSVTEIKMFIKLPQNLKSKPENEPNLSTGTFS